MVVAAARGEHGEVGEDVVLGVASYPSSVDSDSCQHNSSLFAVSSSACLLKSREDRNWKGEVPYIIEHTGHHPLLSLPYRQIQSFGLAFALCQRGRAADGAVGIHYLDWFLGMAVFD